MPDRRLILTGLVAAPFVARLGVLMPVRAIELPKTLVRPVYHFGFDGEGRLQIRLGEFGDPIDAAVFFHDEQLLALLA